MVQHILIVRHASTQLNAHHQLRGWKDVPLSPEGEKEADKVAKGIAKEGIADVIATSDLIRAADTAKTISKVTGKPIIKTTKGLRPWDLGEFSGQDSVKARPILQGYIEENPDEKVP